MGEDGAMWGYLIVGVLLLVLVGAASRRRILPLPTWRIRAGVGAVAAFAAGAFFALRNAWPIAALMLVLGLWLAVSARMPRGPTVRPHARGGGDRNRRDESMSLAEARSILGVSEEATREEIQTAYKRLMIRVHPDNGGAPGLAARLNAARDRLLKK